MNRRGFHHLLWELVDNGLREAAVGGATAISVTLHADGSCTVADDGRGIPVDVDCALGISVLDLVFTRFGAAPNLHGDADPNDGAGPSPSSIGLTVVNFMSAWVDVEVRRAGAVHRLRFREGVATGDPATDGLTEQSGTRITFMPDPLLFEELTFDHDLIAKRLRELAALHRGVTITYSDERIGLRHDLHFADGLADFVRASSAEWAAVTDVIPFQRGDPARRIFVEGALRYVVRPRRWIRTFANDGETVFGTHLDGFNAGVRAAFDGWAVGAGVTLDRRARHLGGLWRGLIAVVAVKLVEPSYGGCTKDELKNPEVRDLVTTAVADPLASYLWRHPSEARQLVEIAHARRTA